MMEDNKVLGKEVLEKLPEDLQVQILKEYFGKVLTEYKFFTNNFSEDFIKAISIKMKEAFYGPGEIIYNFDDSN